VEVQRTLDASVVQPAYRGQASGEVVTADKSACEIPEKRGTHDEFPEPRLPGKEEGGFSDQGASWGCVPVREVEKVIIDISFLSGRLLPVLSLMKEAYGSLMVVEL
jgi:hypothetical protein